MRRNIILYIFLFILGGRLNSKPLNTNERSDALRVGPHARIINNNDSIIFDLANSTLTSTFIDIPLYIKSDDAIFSFDYALKFNLTKLTFSTTIDLFPSNPFSYFNPADLFLRYTNMAQQNFPSSGNVYITKIRFSLAAPCITICNADFTDILTILNGVQCAYRVTSLSFAKFKPNANFKHSPLCLNEVVQFTDSTSISSGSICSWQWNFGNGITSSFQNNVITYTATGIASTTLIVSSIAGCKDTSIVVENIGVNPVSSFTYSYNCVKDSVFFTNTSTIVSGTITSSLWYFGDLSAINALTQPSHHFALSGSYNVKLTTSSNSSCKSSVTNLVALRPADINRDGTTDVNDFLIFVPAYGTNCNQ